MKKNLIHVKGMQAVIAAIGLVLLVSSCRFGFLDDSQMGSAEEEMVIEQSAASMSVDEGGLVYSAEMILDPAFYSDVYASGNAVFNPSTGALAVTVNANVNQASAAVAVDAVIRFYDQAGNQQSAYNAATTYAVRAELTMAHSIDAARFDAYVSKSMSLSATGLNSTQATVNGSWNADRDAVGSAQYGPGLELSMSQSFTVQNLTFSRANTSAAFALSGGSASGHADGSVNGRSFDRTMTWQFGEYYTAQMNFEGEIIQVDVQTGIVL